MTDTPPPFTNRNTSSFNAPSQNSPRHAPTPSGGNNNPLVVTARKIWGAATKLYFEYSGNEFLQHDLAQLEFPMQEFTNHPTPDGWYTIYNILLQLEQVKELNGYAQMWIATWMRIKPH